MKDRAEVGTLLSTAVEVGNIESVRVRQILIQDTGEVVTYALGSLTDCNEDGSPLT